MDKKTIINKDVTDLVFDVAKEMNDVVSSTLGPKGRWVMLGEDGKNSFLTKDGVSIAKRISFDDPVMDSIARIIKQASERTLNEAGDGTTTTIVLTNAILSQAKKYLNSGVAAISLKHGIEKAVEVILEKISESSVPLKTKDDMKKIATISANGDSIIGEIVASAIDVAGKDGAVLIEESKSLSTHLDLVEGFRFDSGYVSPSFINEDKKAIAKYKNALFLVTDADVKSLSELLPILEQCARDKKPLIVVADNISGEALAALIFNSIKHKETGMGMPVCAIKAPYYAEDKRQFLKDLSVVVGATFFSAESGNDIKKAKLSDLGMAASIEIYKNQTIITDGAGDEEKISDQIEQIKNIIMQTDSIEECKFLQERISRLSSGIAIIKVGGSSEVEALEKKYRIEDALEAVKAAISGGIVPGGGSVYNRISDWLSSDMLSLSNEDEKYGFLIVKQALLEPFNRICSNSGKLPELIKRNIELLQSDEKNIGYNAFTDKYVDMLEEGIVDPANVLRSAIKNASSVATSLLMTNCAVISK